MKQNHENFFAFTIADWNTPAAYEALGRLVVKKLMLRSAVVKGTKGKVRQVIVYGE